MCFLVDDVALQQVYLLLFRFSPVCCHPTDGPLCGHEVRCVVMRSVHGSTRYTRFVTKINQDFTYTLTLGSRKDQRLCADGHGSRVLRQSVEEGRKNT